MELPTPPRSRKEADAQLQNLVQERRALRGQKNTFTPQQLGGALKLISEQLYSSSTHFILELIQNADDNDYSAAIKQNLLPSFSLSLKSLLDADGQMLYDLETGCNENGFSLQQIDALCSIGKSTKKSAKDVHSGYIGEKGIGFKSVFKVASVVHISSGFYHFKLNKTEDMLGVLLPLPSPVTQESHHTENTRMRLWISDRQDHGRIAEDLRKIKPEILLFLRRLRHIVVQVGTEEAEYQATYTSHDEELQGEVRSVAISKSITEAKKETKYIIVRRTVNEMPTEPKRKNIHYSEVTLAFPVEQNGSPITREQQIFAYLPVGDYGFRFLIQSDFILLADRERLPEGNAWNNKLAGAVINAFGDAVERFNKIGEPIQYSWPQYLERTPSRDVFWDSLDAKLVNFLKSSRVLRSRLGCIQVPETLIFIPPDFCLNNAPLIDCPKQRAGHLAAEYTPQNSLPLGLARLGVTTMNEERFISDFCQWVSQGKPDLSSKSTEWHGKISAILAAAGYCKARLRNLPLLPTTKGSFVAASTANLYLASREVAWSAPSGLELVLVDPEARDDHRREALFQRLGVEELWKRSICETIVRDHRTKHKRDDQRSLDCLVEDMVYLFLHRHLLAGLRDARDLKSIWVQADDDLSPTRARYVYYVDPDAPPNLLSQHVSNPEAPMRVLHPAYLERASYLVAIRESVTLEDSTAIAVAGEDLQLEARLTGETSAPKKETHPFVEWLQSSCGIAVLPRLTFFDMDLRDMTLSRECRWLIAKDPKGLLLLLRDHLFKDYHSDLHYIRHEIRSMKISCRDGQERQLKDTAVPSQSLLDSCPHLAFGEFPDPDNANWSCFSSFSVATQVNIMTYMQELQAVRLLCIGTETLGTVGRIYTYLSKNCRNLNGDTKDKLRSNMELVYHPQGGWVPLDACVWQGSSYLPNSLALANIYPASAELFQRTLGVVDVSVAEIVKELVRVDKIQGSSRDHSLLKITILALSESLGKCHPSPVQVNDALRGMMVNLKIFPMLSTHESSGEPPGVVYRSIDEDWYIGDRAVLRRTFVERVHILDFEVDDIDKLMPLIKWLSLDNKVLSSAVQERTTYVGSPVCNRGWSNDIQKKAKCIALLGTNRDMTLPHIEVSLASGLSVERTIGDVHGKTEVGHVSITESKGSVKIVVLKNPFKDSSPRVDKELVDLFVRLYAIEDVSRVSLVSLILKASFGDVRDLLEGANIRASTEVLGFCVDEAEGYAAVEDGGIANLNAAARGVFRQLSLGVPRLLAHATDHGPRIFTSAQHDLPSRFKEIGLKAELHVNNFFQQHLPDWMPEKHWTSHLREEEGHSVFLGDESTTADFTYTDTEGKILQTIGVVRESWSSHTITYHIEVKGTVCEFEEPFHFSQNQMNLARKYAFKHGKIPSDVFLIGRVYNVEKEKPGLKFYWNPWEMINRGSLVMTVSDGYRIAPGNTAAASKAA